jgi:glycosyltransferase 2 family protein
MRYVRAGFFLLGAALLVGIIVENGPRAILASIQQLSWRLAVVVLFPAVLVGILDALGWHYAFDKDTVPFRRLFWARVAGEAFNMTTGPVGGEGVKVWLVRRYLPLAEGFSSVVIAKTTITIAQVLFLLLGIVLTWDLGSGPPVIVGLRVLLVLEVVGLCVFVVAQTRGLFARGGRLLRWFGLPSPRGLERVDESLIAFYRTRRGRFALSIAFHFGAWLLGSLESYLILQFLGLPVSLLMATVIETFGASIRFATFVIPASVGALEGGFAAIFASLGLGSAAGVAFTLVRRIREASWILAGLVAFVVARQGQAPAIR